MAMPWFRSRNILSYSKSVALLTLLVPVAVGCSTGEPEPSETSGLEAVPATGTPAPGPTGPDPEQFGGYWYQGKAELTSYDLDQARYGEIHRGHAVLIFVTEDFSKSKQVKLDRQASGDDDAVTVLKLNFTRKFNTGIYPYSMMTSVFTPVDRSAYPRTLKTTTSSQEWCGHTFSQLNRQVDGYELQLHSYFESEGEQHAKIPDVMLEDEIWTTIRLNPEDLPVGEFNMLPGSMVQRLRHLSWEPANASATLEPREGDSAMLVYRVEYPGSERSLSIVFRREFPHEIDSWEETHVSGWGRGALPLTTRAVLKERILIDYWNKNRVADQALREELGLDG